MRGETESHVDEAEAAMRCSGGFDEDTVGAYLAGRLPADETDSFEIHLIGCGACQSAVEEGAGLRAAFARSEGAAVRGPTGRSASPEAGVGADGRADRRSHLRWALPLLTAAAVSAILLLRPGGELGRLGAVDEAPPFRGAAVRVPADTASVLAAAGMEAYAEGGYRDADELLSEAHALDPSPATAFFAGVSRLLLDDPGAAREALADALSPPGNPYEAEARFYLAKAWLRDGDAEAALSELERVVEIGGALASWAGALADSVAAVTDS